MFGGVHTVWLRPITFGYCSIYWGKEMGWIKCWRLWYYLWIFKFSINEVQILTSVVLVWNSKPYMTGRIFEKRAQHAILATITYGDLFLCFLPQGLESLLIFDIYNSNIFIGHNFMSVSINIKGYLQSCLDMVDILQVCQFRSLNFTSRS